ncbi:MAG TPA: TonB-dependent receptor [Xanthomonadaceae bacterium]
MNHTNRLRLSKLSIGLIVALAAAPAFAQSTASGINGRITGTNGAPVSGAQVTIRHVDSGSVSNATTDGEGRYAAKGLRPGGPYTITVVKDGETKTIEDVYLELSETAAVDANFGAASDDDTLDTVRVVGQADSGVSQVFSATNMGSGTNISREMLEAQPTIDRSIADAVKLDPRIVKIDRETQGISVSGQNPRYNNIKIDGVPTNDNFGLNDSGLPALNQPISGDWIQQYNVGVSGYDVSQSDFVGANINAVTKSGTNEFQGTIYGAYRNNDMIRKSANGNKFIGFEDDQTYGGYFGAPIIKDRLFVFAGYEEFHRNGTLPPRGIPGSNASNILPVTQAQLDALSSNYNRLFPGAPSIGGAPQPFDNTDKKYFLKVDANFNDDHRAAFRYNKTEGSVARYSRTTTQLQLASNVYSDNITFESYALNFYDDWTENLSSEFHISKATYDSLPTSNAFLPQVTIRNIPSAGNSVVVFGTERSRQANQLNVETLTSALDFNWYRGDHEFKFGFDYEKNDVYNLFLQDVYGNYTIDYANFVNPAFTAATLPRAFYNFQRPSAGNTLPGVAAEFEVASLGLLAQDTWAPTTNLTLTFGFRLDRSDVSGVIKENTRFRSDFGIDNRNTTDGNITFQPRFGFNYTFEGDLRRQLRGGIGRFLGSAPGVWVSNSFSNPGVGVDSFSVTGGSGVVMDAGNPLVPTTGGVASRQVNALARDFEQPTVLKANLAFETELGFWDLVGGAELLLTQVEKGVHFVNVALGTPNGALPDGRESYFLTTAQTGFTSTGGFAAGNRGSANCIRVNPAAAFNSATNPCAYTNAIIMQNTDKGSASNLTLFLEKPWKDNWTARLSYTHGTSEEVSPATSSVAFSNWNGRFVYNPNEEVTGRSNYEIRDRFAASASYRFNFFENAPTTVSMYYEGRSGRPFSYAFANDANGDGQSNDLFYIPSSQGDVRYSSASTAQDIAAFWDYINSNSYLREHLGQVAKRNGDRSPFVNQFDLRISQKLPFFRNRQSEIYLDIQNIGNMLNKDWGRIEEAGFPSRVQMARFAGVNGGQYVYDVSNFYNESANAATSPALELRDVAGESRWSVQVGFKVNF